MINVFKKILCKIGWHKISIYHVDSNSINIKGKCKRCGFIGIIDSQGNLF